MVDEDLAPKYLAEAAICLSCEQLGAAARSASEDAGGKPQHGMYWGVTTRR